MSGQDEDEVRRLPWPEREAQLLRHLDEKPYLFVLDGLERILLAYHRMDASYLADDEYDEKTANVVAGAAGLPATAAQSFVGQHRLRQTTDPRAGAFLQKLTQTAKSRILITTRLSPWALQLPSGKARPGCFPYFLHGLSDDDALGLWRALGVSGSRADLAPIFHSVEGHPLLVQALASEIANYRKAPGDFVQWRADHPRFDSTSLPLVQSRTHILKFALEGLSGKVREVLHTLLGFRMPASYATLEVLLVGADKACGSAQELDQALTELEDRGLIGWDREANRYDAHPIVRGVVGQLTERRTRHAIYAALEAHFESMPTPEWNEVRFIDDLTPAIERYNALIESERYDDAIVLFASKLNFATMWQIGAYQQRITWLEQLFPNGVANLPALTTEDSQAFALVALAQSYRVTGLPGRAIGLYQIADEIDSRLGRMHPRQTSIVNLGISQLDAGELRQMAAYFTKALDLNRDLGDIYQEGVTLDELGRAAAMMGNVSLGAEALSRSRRIWEKQKYDFGKALIDAYLAECILWFSGAAKAATWADRAWELTQHEQNERAYVRVVLLHGRIAVGLGELDRAYERLNHALTRARAVNVVEFELPALIALAELELRRGHSAEAKNRLDEVWEAAERGPYPLHQADAYNVLAAIAIAENNTVAAVDAATKAYTVAWCDGPPYAYHWGLQKAKAHLAALGAPEPVLPPFDESKFEPLPEVEINPRDEYWVDPDKLD